MNTMDAPLAYAEGLGISLRRVPPRHPRRADPRAPSRLVAKPRPVPSGTASPPPSSAAWASSSAPRRLPHLPARRARRRRAARGVLRGACSCSASSTDKVQLKPYTKLIGQIVCATVLHDLGPAAALDLEPDPRPVPHHLLARRHHQRAEPARQHRRRRGRVSRPSRRATCVYFCHTQGAIAPGRWQPPSSAACSASWSSTSTRRRSSWATAVSLFLGFFLAGLSLVTTSVPGARAGTSLPSSRCRCCCCSCRSSTRRW